MKKYYFLFTFLIIFGLFAVGVLIYRAYQTDQFFAETASESSSTVLEGK